jgi:signal transduction histidine kinase
MKHYLKQFTESDTASKYKKYIPMFEYARLKLTLFYVFIMCVIMGVFSFALFNSIKSNIQESLINSVDRIEARNFAYTRIVNNVKTFLIYTDGALILIIAALSYALAGKTLRPIREALELQKRFSADASHDLRTPLAIIITESEVLLHSNSKNVEDYKAVIESNLQEAKKMSQLATDLLFIARSEDGTLPGDALEIDIKEFIDKLEKGIARQAKEKGVTISTSHIFSAHIMAHEHSLERAIGNILQNALKYTETGGAINIGMRDSGNTVSIEIRDTGIGIPTSDLPKIFQRFYKGSHARSDAGYGLGLPIAKEIIENHGGTITIESKDGTGTSVCITLPKK